LSLQLWLSPPPPTLLYLFLDIRFPASKDGRFLCLSTLSVSKQAHKTSHRCMRCELHADLPCICTSRKVAHPKKRSNNQSSTKAGPVQTATTLKRPIMLSSRHRPSGAVPDVRPRKSSKPHLPTQGTATPFPAPTSHDSPFASSIGEFWAVCPSPIREVVSQSYVRIRPRLLLR
jgi:hypothetical protein